MFACLLALSSTFASAPARADETPAAKADALFKEGRALMKNGDYRAACPLLAESQRLDPAAGTLINLGDCTDQLGRVADALEAYRGAAQLLPPDDPRRGPVAEQIRALERRVPTIRLRLVGPAPAGLRVTWDGVVLEPKAWRSALPANAGAHELVVTIPGEPANRQKVVLSEGEKRALSVELAGQAETAPHISTTPTHEPSKSTDVVPWIVGGAGVASLAASGVFFLLHGRETRKLERDCIDGICPTSSESTIDRANLYGTAGWVGLAAGAVGVGAAVVLLSTRGGEAPAASRRPRLEIGAGATRGGGAAFARARF